MKARSSSPWDIVFLGGASLAVAPFAALAPLGGAPSPAVVWAVVYGFSLPHFAASYVLFYGRPELVRRHPVIACAGPAAAVAFVTLAVFAGRAEILAGAAQLGYAALLWHYAKQAYGAASWLARVDRDGAPPAATRRLLLGTCLAIGVEGYLASQSGAAHFSAFGIGVAAIPVARWCLTLATCASSAALATSAVIAGAGALRGRTEDFPPAALVPIAALYVWLRPSVAGPAFLSLLPCFHALQYFPFCYRVFRCRLRGDRQRFIPTRAVLAGVFCAGLGALLFVLLPRLVATHCAPALLLALNLHHFLVDSVMWRLRAPTVAADLGAGGQIGAVITRRLAGDAGYSLVEMAIALLVSSFVGLAVARGAVLVFDAGAGLARQAARDRISRKFSQDFIRDVEGADASLHFAHLPIRVGSQAVPCREEDPCVRALRDDGTLGPFAWPGVTTVEFFRDARGELSPRSALGIGDTVRLLANAPLEIDEGTLRANIYATWPLVDEASPPFVLLKRAAGGRYFTLVDELATSHPAHAWVFVDAPAAAADALPRVGSLVAIYHSSATSHYFFQAVAGAMDCRVRRGAESQCAAAARALVAGYDVGRLTDAGHHFFALALRPVGAPEFFRNQNAAADSWWGQDRALTLFPSAHASLWDAATPDLASPVDARKLAHFYHKLTDHAQTGGLLVVPVDAGAYALRDVRDGARVARRRLVYRRFAEASESIALDDLPATGRVTFARRIGTSTITVFENRE